MIKKLKLRKNTLPVSKNTKLGIAAATLVLLIAAGFAGWYYLVYLPDQELKAKKVREQTQLAADVKVVDAFYLKALTGGSISAFTKLAVEITNSYSKLYDMNYTNETFSCDAQKCAFSYQLSKGAIFSVAQKIFWGKTYNANFSENTFDFTEVKSGLSENPLLNAYKRKQEISPPACSNALNYIYSYNSATGSEQALKITALPGAAVIATEKKISQRGKAKYYGLNVISWEMSLPKPLHYLDILNIASVLERHAFKDAFIIQKVDSSKENKITGVMVCRSGK
ncbi:hypothetical protein [Rahnella perminowiae]|uniref:hypothetical protein n=1 Tax=Rahnella perminowiae TaxID=2816244 RepID=UPI00215D4D90|nr:hypothetical protein [Rahnella perminowiae]MCR8999754.1 hypothetical protein [Rahnella perminowiae]